MQQLIRQHGPLPLPIRRTGPSAPRARARCAQLRWAAGFVGVCASCALLAWYAWWLVPLLVLPAAVNRLIRSRQAFGFTSLWRESIDEARRAGMWEDVITSASEGKEVRLYGLGMWAVNRIQQHTMAVVSPIWVRFEKLLRNEWNQFLLVGVPLVIAYVVVALDAVHGGTSVAVEMAVVAASWSVFQWLKYSEDVRDMAGAKASLDALEELRTVLAHDRPQHEHPSTDVARLGRKVAAGPLRERQLPLPRPGTYGAQPAEPGDPSRRTARDRGSQRRR